MGLEFLLFLAPALLLATPLALGRYPGEEAIRSLAAPARIRLLAGARPARLAEPRECRRIPASRGPQLLARSLAKRPPPSSLVLT